MTVWGWIINNSIIDKNIERIACKQSRTFISIYIDLFKTIIQSVILWHLPPGNDSSQFFHS